MALTWSVAEVEDYENVCFYEAEQDDPAHGVTAGDRMLNPLTSALIWATMAVDLPGITRANAPEFYARLHFVEKHGGAHLIRPMKNGVRPEGAAAFITPEEVIAHIGLTANVTPKSRSKWLQKFSFDLDRDEHRVLTLLAEASTAVEDEEGGEAG